MAYRLSDNALVNPLDDGAIVVNSATGKYYSLNETAAAMLAMLEKGAAEAEIVEAIVDRYEVAPDLARTDLARLVHDLEQHALIMRE